ncbi:hypothetical protein [Paenibacillus durus]|uniref:hypothetical protein n=1 Tax=Paenibacillus durus TaxID=44251 RepID=UPI0005A99FB7|nr:hypothetical protein [Paenibacillus durus]
MWLLNKETGLTWKIDDPELLRRLQANVQYEEINKPDQQESVEVKADEMKPKTKTNVKRKPS